MGDAAEHCGPPRDWPRRGLLVMKTYQPVPYALGKKCILQPLTLTMQPGEHVAIIGRSGAGKSTLLAGLSQLLPTGGGTLELDGWASTSVRLRRWREALQCIPQQPLLLAGSVRHNLDPYGRFSDDALWEALRATGLEQMLRDLPRKLETEVEAGDGDHIQLSAGQRQLLALSRLLLRRQNARLVLLDEPAAGLEQQEGVRLQRVLKERLVPEATAITITHRILPVLHNFSRVLVFADGRCVEDGSPEGLLERQGGHLHELFLQAAPRLQAHVKRLIALQRSQGLRAVGKLIRAQS